MYQSVFQFSVIKQTYQILTNDDQMLILCPYFITTVQQPLDQKLDSPIISDITYLDCTTYYYLPYCFLLKYIFK